jgi:hypothetical protein
VAISHGRDLVESCIRRFCYELWNDWRLDLAEQLLSPALEFRGSLGKEVRGRDGFVAYAQIVRAAFPDFHNEVRELVIDETAPPRCSNTQARTEVESLRSRRLVEAVGCHSFALTLLTVQVGV